MLLPAQCGGLFIEELPGAPPVEFIHAHGSDAGFDLVAACLKLLDGFSTSRLLSSGRN